MIKSTKDAIRLWFLQRAHRRIKRKKKFLNHNNARSFGILYDASVEDHYRFITLLVKDLQQDQKRVKTLGFVTQKKMPEYCFPKLTFEFCNAASFNWMQKPKQKNINDFLAEDFDVLIDFTPSGFFQMKYVTAISMAKMKTGRFAEKYIDIYDFMIHLDDKASIKETSDQMIHYLKMFDNEKRQ